MPQLLNRPLAVFRLPSYDFKFVCTFLYFFEQSVTSELFIYCWIVIIILREHIQFYNICFIIWRDLTEVGKSDRWLFCGCRATSLNPDSANLPAQLTEQLSCDLNNVTYYGTFSSLARRFAAFLPGISLIVGAASIPRRLQRDINIPSAFFTHFGIYSLPTNAIIYSRPTVCLHPHRPSSPIFACRAVISFAQPYHIIVPARTLCSAYRPFVFTSVTTDDICDCLS